MEDALGAFPVRFLGVFVVMEDKRRGDVGGRGASSSICLLGATDSNEGVVTRFVINHAKKRSKAAAAASHSEKFVHISLRKLYMLYRENVKLQSTPPESICPKASKTTAKLFLGEM